MSGILLCLAIFFSAKFVLRSSDRVQDRYGNGRREQEGIVLAVVPQAFQVYLDPCSTVSEGQREALLIEL